MNITVYGKPGCRQCIATTRKMTELDISYQYVDISEDMDALAHIVRLGHQQAPVVMTPTTSWSGYNPDKIATLVL